jgi:hypothetical protein
VFWVIREDASATDDYRFLLNDCCSTTISMAAIPARCGTRGPRPTS